MKLKNSSLAPVGGWKFRYPVEKCPRFPDGEFFYVNNGASEVNNFVRLVRTAMVQNGITVPENLSEIVEDYICSYQPANRCNYTKKLGDRVSKVIHTAAAVADKVTKGKYKLEKKARKCFKCGSRRNKLNQV